MNKNRIRINQQIKAAELRVLGPAGENLGVLTFSQALKTAMDSGLDLIEISPTANPPIAKIADYGKFQYEQSKKQKEIKSKVKTVEVKNIQVKIGTSDHDLEMKAKRATEWLKEGHRVKVDLFLPGRSKYLKEDFLKERVARVLNLISVDYKVAEAVKKSPKGLTVVIEKAGKA